MKIIILGPANSVHISKIANELLKNNLDVLVVSLPDHKDKQTRINCRVVYMKYGGKKGYCLNALQLKKLVREENCDVVNAHYASGYGTLATLANFKKTIVSVWGSDVYMFPYKSILHKTVIRYVLLRANLIFSTSECMKRQTQKFVRDKGKIIVTPFGVDINEFRPEDKRVYKNKVEIGFLKGTKYIYGFDIFLKAIELVYKQCRLKGIDIHAKVCGDRDNEDKLLELITSLKVNEIVDYIGPINHCEMSHFINLLDIICIPSRMESFGVVAIEAMSCGVPCITSAAPGLVEIIEDRKTGIIVADNDINRYADSIMELILNVELRTKMGIQARKTIERKYNFEENIQRFIKGIEQVDNYAK